MANIAHLRDQDFQFIRHDVTQYIDVEGPVDCVLHWASPASPIDYLELPIQTLKVGIARHAQRARPGQGQGGAIRAWPRRPRSTAIRSSIRSAKPTGATSTRSARAACTTRPSASPRRSRSPTTGRTASTPRSSASSTPTARGCGCATAAPCRRSCRRRCSNEDVTVFGDGTQTRSFCYVTDLVDGILRLMDSDTHEPVNIGNPHEVTIEQIARTIITLVGSTSRIVYRPLPRGRPEAAPARHHARAHAARLGAEGRARGGAVEDGRLLQDEAGGGGSLISSRRRRK